MLDGVWFVVPENIAVFAATTSETRIGIVLNGFDAELQALVNAVDIGRHGKEHRVLPVATLLDGVEVPQLLVGFRWQLANFLFLVDEYM